MVSDYSFLRDEDLEKIAQVVNDQSKVVKITDDEAEALQYSQQLKSQGINAHVVTARNSYHVMAQPVQKILLQEAKESEHFTKVAADKYKFSKVANNPLGLQQYDFDDGTIWKVMTAKDGREYLVKEIDDNNAEKVIRQPCEPGFKSVVLAASKNNPNQLVSLCKALYDNSSEEFINDLIKYSASSLAKIITAKLNNVVDSTLQALNIQSPALQNTIRKRVAEAINNNQILNKEQLNNIITKNC